MLYLLHMFLLHLLRFIFTTRYFYEIFLHALEYILYKCAKFSVIRGNDAKKTLETWPRLCNITVYKKNCGKFIRDRNILPKILLL